MFTIGNKLPVKTTIKVKLLRLLFIPETVNVTLCDTLREFLDDSDQLAHNVNILFYFKEKYCFI